MQTFTKRNLLVSSLLTSAILATIPAGAQDAPRDQVIVTGTRITSPGIVSASPIESINTAELDLKQTIEVENLFRDLPITITGDGQNVNNGTDGVATIDLRALGPQRTLILVDGKRLTPYDIDGEVDTQTIPVNLIERIDIVTGGASAVYGSDALAGAVNFILKDDYEGVTVEGVFGFDDEFEAQRYNISALLGANFDGGRGNAVLSVSRTERDPLLLGERELGLFGISTANGPAPGGAPASPPANCDAPNTTLSSTGVGSTTSIPTALDLPAGTLQFQNDRTLEPRCSRFNFNPFNYYQTPQERWQLNAKADYEITDFAEAYTNISYTNVSVRQQVAPSGIFGVPLNIPLQNPFLSQSARDSIVTAINDHVIATNTGEASMLPGFTPITFEDPTVGGIDNNGNGIFDDQDSILVPVRRRTLEFGTRSTDYVINSYRFVVGLRGTDVFNTEWDYDISYQRGESNFDDIARGYTNLTNIANAINTVSDTTCTTPSGEITSGCVPLDIFGEFGTPSAAAIQYSAGTAFELRQYTQDVAQVLVNGPINALTSPLAKTPVSAAFGFEYRSETGSTNPDLCWREGCLGGAGGNRLPVSSEYSVYEYFGETIIPLVEDLDFVKNLSVELGVRISDYDPFGGVENYKAGVTWAVNDDFRARASYQRATRVPNIGELGAPQVEGLSDASFDPCSNGNPNTVMRDDDGNIISRNIPDALRALCVSTGTSLAQVGFVNDIVSNQIGTFEGTSLTDIPSPETANTFTAGFVYQPSWTEKLLPGWVSEISRPIIAIDYFNIDITDVISEFSAQEILDLCYTQGVEAECAKVQRINGSLATDGAGIELFTENLEYLRTEGLDISISTAFDLGDWGELRWSAYASWLFSQESLSGTGVPVVDCLGRFGNDCPPTPKFNVNERTTWSKGPYSVSLLWRRIGPVNIQEAQRDNTFDDFERISAQNYFDLTTSYKFFDDYKLSIGIRNIFDKQAPVVGNGAGETSFNSGNTFPSTYDILGRTYRVSLIASF